jgi:hypothetical protein
MDNMRDTKCVKNVQPENPKGRDISRDVNVDERIILKMILKEQNA